MKGMCIEKIKPLSKLGDEKIVFTPKPDILTYICNYRVESLLKIYEIMFREYLLSNATECDKVKNTFIISYMSL